MRRMDPDFAEAFNSEYPEAYGEAIRDKRRGRMKDAAIAVHVPVFPVFMSRFTAGLLVMLFLIGAFFLISQSSAARGMGIPSGSQVFHSSTASKAGGTSVFGTVEDAIGAVSDPNNDLGQKLSPIGEAGNDLLRAVMR